MLTVNLLVKRTVVQVFGQSVHDPYDFDSIHVKCCLTKFGLVRSLVFRSGPGVPFCRVTLEPNVFLLDDGAECFNMAAFASTLAFRPEHGYVVGALIVSAFVPL